MNATGGDGGDSSVPIASADAPVISGMTEATIRQTIAHLEALLPERTLTIRELWDRHQQTLPNAKWVGSMASTMKVFLARFGDVPVAKFTARDWENYRDDPETKARYCVTTRSIQLRRAKAMFNWATATDRIPFNPLDRVKYEKAKPPRETEVTHEGEAAVLDRARPMMQAFILAAVDGMMRHDEVRRLEWDQIDFKAGTVTLHAIKTKGKRHRTVELTPRALEALNYLPRRCRYVFANKNTLRPFSASTMGRAWRAVAKKAGLEPAPGDGSVRYHDLRATGATRLSRLGAQVPAIQKILSHKSVQTTMLYIRVNPQDVKDAYALLKKSQRKGPQRARGAQSKSEASKNKGAVQIKFAG